MKLGNLVMDLMELFVSLKRLGDIIIYESFRLKIPQDKDSPIMTKLADLAIEVRTMAFRLTGDEGEPVEAVDFRKAISDWSDRLDEIAVVLGTVSKVIAKDCRVVIDQLPVSLLLVQTAC